MGPEATFGFVYLSEAIGFNASSGLLGNFTFSPALRSVSSF